ncbi:hypothetical protein [Skermanella stibiiresistens]|uniref:hypothetical protein n=1 Tax=Skermanella stibiiresistens TaxID=913326 RepID=UPI0012F7BBC5|nr:hypothetical protein [Skermanella stibiiresistens]
MPRPLEEGSEVASRRLLVRVPDGAREPGSRQPRAREPASELEPLPKLAAEPERRTV